MTGTGEAHETEDDPEPRDQDRPVSDPVKAIAERRLAQITRVLGVERTQFERAYRSSAQDLDQGILAKQAREAAELLAAVPDPLVRLRLVELLTSLARDESDC